MLATINKRTAKFLEENLGEWLDPPLTHLNQTDLMKRYGTQKAYRTLVRYASEIEPKYVTLVRYGTVQITKYVVRKL